MTKPVWSHFLALSALSNHVIDMLLVYFAITLNHRQTFMLLSNTLACVKAEI